MEWKPLVVNGYKTNYIINTKGDIKHIITGHKKLTHPNANGYLMVNIYYNHDWDLLQVHRLVASTFIPNPENKPEVNHIDGVKTNNDVSNLEWVTRMENIRHAYSTGLNVNKPGFDSRHNIYSKEMITMVIECLKKGLTNMSEIARVTGVPVDTVFLIKTGKRYRELSESLGYVPIQATPRFDFTPYHDKIFELVQKGYSSKDIRTAIPLPINDMQYNYYIRKLRNLIV